MIYRYETHLHTCQASACGRSTGREHAQYYLDQGYQGIILTDHFFGGNTAVPRTGRWEDRVHQFCSGFEDAWNEGQRIGLDVFFAWEQNYHGDEYLIYGLDENWLLAHPEIEHCSRREQLKLVHEGGGCVVQAHPFRFRGYLDKIRLAPDDCDAVEIANAGNDPLSDYYAKIYAEQYQLPAIAGSDNHFSAPGCKLMGVGLNEKLRDMKHFSQIILQHGPITLLCDEGRFDPPAQRRLPLPCYSIDEKGELSRYRASWLLDSDA